MAVIESSDPHVTALYCDHHGWLSGWLRKKLGNPADAADLAHDTFVGLLTSRRPGPVEQPRAYLAAIARNVLVNRDRRQALERAYLDTLALLPEPETPSPEYRLSILQTLHEIDAMSFHVHELDETVAAKHRPVVIITSNAEKELPDAFLRRCVFHYIDFPKREAMEAIVRVHFPEVDERLMESVIVRFYEVRRVRGGRPA